MEQQKKPKTQLERLAYRPEEAAEVAGISRDTLYKAIGEGKLIPKQLGSRTVIPADRLRAFINDLPDLTTMRPDRAAGHPKRNGRMAKVAA